MNDVKDLVPRKDVKGGNYMTNPTNESHDRQLIIGSNTYFSIGIIMAVCGGIWAILSAINGAKSDIGSARAEIIEARREVNAHFDKLELRVQTLESARNTWTATDMFKWAVHLQQANPQLKVPEPEVSTK